MKTYRIIVAIITGLSLVLVVSFSRSAEQGVVLGAIVILLGAIVLYPVPIYFQAFKRNPQKHLAILGVIVTLSLAAWFFRYDVSGGSLGPAYILDRWTGKVVMCIGDNCTTIHHTRP